MATAVEYNGTRARQYMERGLYDEAWELVNEALRMDPNCVPALIDGTYIHDRARRLPIAYQLAARAIELAPKKASVWTNYGRVSESLYRLDEARQAYQAAIKLCKPHRLASDLSNLASCYATSGDFPKCEEIALRALEVDPQHQKARGNLGIAQLAQRKWKEGWPNYDAILGTDIRKLVKYRQGDEPEWDGTPNARIVVYGEQGLGDELSFASMIPDAIAISRKVTIDCDKRLEHLFRRSFPGANVYGTRWEKAAIWDEWDQHPQYSMSIGQLGKLFRNQDCDFPGTPYMVSDPERTLMWKALFASKRKPVIGIAWSGGLPWTAERFRRWGLPELQPLFDAVDAHWVCLQYKDAKEEIAQFEGAAIHQYPHATLTKDYDDTAALVAACDLVICMQTSVGHLAAAMGIETWCFVNKLCQWRYGTDEMLWYKAMKLYRQSEKGNWPIQEAARVLKLRYGSLSLKTA